MYQNGAHRILKGYQNTFGCDWDEKGQVRKQLNAFFLPRLYLLDSDKRVLYVQPPRKETDAVCDEIRALARTL